MHRLAATPLLLFALVYPTAAAAQDGPSKAVTLAAMKRAATFYREDVARHGGYVYFATIDLKRRFGEGEATPDQIWVQPPGTPTVGMAYLAAYEATGDEFFLDAATETAEALVYGQLVSGCWQNSVDFDPRGKRALRYRNGKGNPKGRNFSSLDDDQSQSAIRFLMRVDRAHRFEHEAVHESVEVALAALLRAQFRNGAFPQGWDGPVDQRQPVLQASFPEYDWRTENRVKNYWDMYTLNDDLAGSVSRVLIEAHATYEDPRYRQALERFGDFLLLAQLPAPQPAWAQQYDYGMRPIWARKFEPPAVSGSESQDVLETLMTIYEATGGKRFLEPIPRALEYLEKSELPDGRMARYYELRTNRPLYMERRGKVYSLTYDDSNLPDHYGWKRTSKLDRIAERFERVKSGEKPKPPSAKSVARKAMAALESLDDRGRWVTVSKGEKLIGDNRFPEGDQYLSSEVFSENLEALAAWYAATK